MKTKTTKPEGVTCTCGKFEPFNSWVYAHWHEMIVLTCEQCGKRHWLKHGRIIQTAKNRKWR